MQQIGPRGLSRLQIKGQRIGLVELFAQTRIGQSHQRGAARVFAQLQALPGRQPTI